MNWISIEYHSHLEDIKEKSFTRFQLIFKHSTRCSISSMAKSRLERANAPKNIGDALRLKQVLTNLVSNAIKFTKQGEVVIRVMVEDSRPNHHLLRVSITDTGIGLSKSAQQDLFQAFQQGNPSVSRQFGGTGLGLVISKNIVKLMEGEISFDTGQEQGTTFWFTFKAWLCHDHVDSDISLPHKNVLALEPHEKSAQLLKATLFRASNSRGDRQLPRYAS